MEDGRWQAVVGAAKLDVITTGFDAQGLQKWRRDWDSNPGFDLCFLNCSFIGKMTALDAIDSFARYDYVMTVYGQFAQRPAWKVAVLVLRLYY
jgi:hypothetical protein